MIGVSLKIVFNYFLIATTTITVSVVIIFSFETGSSKYNSLSWNNLPLPHSNSPATACQVLGLQV